MSNNLAELKGFILLILAIVGCCPFGPVADVIKGFSAFLVGTWWAVLLMFVAACGIYMIIKREKPNFLDIKFLGLYIMLIALLSLSHTSYINTIEGIDVNKFNIVDDTMLVVEETIKYDLSRSDKYCLELDEKNNVILIKEKSTNYIIQRLDPQELSRFVNFLSNSQGSLINRKF